jgi:carbonic anhydrase
MTTGVDKLVKGYHRYRDGPYEQSRQLIEALVAHGQRPEVAVVACSDSRVDPAILFQADPGDLFVIRNVANLVPPMEKEGTYHGTSAALEYAVLGLGVKHMVVLGHAHCGGIKAMMAPDTRDAPYTFVPSWVSMLDAAHRRVLATMAQASEEARTRACEQNAVLVSLENLTTFPWVRSRVKSGDLELHGWYIDIAAPELCAFDWGTGKFMPV